MKHVDTDSSQICQEPLQIGTKAESGEVRPPASPNEPHGPIPLLDHPGAGEAFPRHVPAVTVQMVHAKHTNVHPETGLRTRQCGNMGLDAPQCGRIKLGEMPNTKPWRDPMVRLV